MNPAAYRATRIALLRNGETQWGHTGQHHGHGTDECPVWLHHHHDIKCERPTPWECAAAGVEWRRHWGYRGP